MFNIIRINQDLTIFLMQNYITLFIACHHVFRVKGANLLLLQQGTLSFSFKILLPVIRTVRQLQYNYQLFQNLPLKRRLSSYFYEDSSLHPPLIVRLQIFLLFCQPAVFLLLYESKIIPFSLCE